ncbi:MAG: SRPBCC family protein [Acidobacteria bacterium]|nr:SRPBCC family protein [Acidobacteriota bacterium]
MAELSFSIEIAAPPGRVAAFFVPQRMVYWYGRDIGVELELLGGAADFAVGQKVRITGKMGSREISMTAVVTRFRPGESLEWQFKDAHGVRGAQAWDLEPAPDGGTHVLMRDVYSFPGRLGNFFDKIFMRHAVARRDRLWLGFLQRLAERA